MRETGRRAPAHVEQLRDRLRWWVAMWHYRAAGRELGPARLALIGRRARARLMNAAEDQGDGKQSSIGHVLRVAREVESARAALPCAPVCG